MDIYGYIHFGSIVYFLQKYFTNAFFDKFFLWIHPIGGDHLTSLIDLRIVYIYSLIFVCDYPLSYLKRCIEWNCSKHKVRDIVGIEDNLDKTFNFLNYFNIENKLIKTNNFSFCHIKEILYYYNNIYSDITYSLYSNTRLLRIKIYISDSDELVKDTFQKQFVLFSIQHDDYYKFCKLSMHNLFTSK
ncbi:hypothetical protein PFHG_05602 [Plasmodium falciparum HB3]|uniref:Uncharacterized protein n=1 Tax=Plasmodium falciparum (isolate HB3) TaxID=137071 RepID=A0A0L7KMG6_PLAFX|nr:hypothetical protein PFHG_05602 [Plasmodium falciparum HB3]